MLAFIWSPLSGHLKKVSPSFTVLTFWCPETSEGNISLAPNWPTVHCVHCLLDRLCNMGLVFSPKTAACVCKQPGGSDMTVLKQLSGWPKNQNNDLKIANTPHTAEGVDSSVQATTFSVNVVINCLNYCVKQPWINLTAPVRLTKT